MSNEVMSPIADDVDALKRLIMASMFTKGYQGRWGLPLIIWGPIGAGKSSIIEQVAFETGLGFNCTIGSIHEPPEIAGMMLPDQEGKCIEMLAAPWVRKINEDPRGGVQLFDEATSNPRAIQSALMQVVLTGTAGGIKLHNRVRLIMAGNPVDVAANANDLEMPLANRLGHIHFEGARADDWADWLAGGIDGPAEEIVAEALEAKVEEVWDKEFAKARGLIASFIRKRSGLLHKQPDPGSNDASLAWPSRRTWEFAARALAGATIHNLDSAERAAFIGAFVGHGPCGELLQWERMADLPDPIDVLDGKESFELDPNRIDRTFAMLETLASIIIPRPRGGDSSPEGQLRLARAARYFELCERVFDAGDPDLVVPSAKNVVQKGQIKPSTNCPAGKSVMVKLQPLLSAVLGRRR